MLDNLDFFVIVDVNELKDNFVRKDEIKNILIDIDDLTVVSDITCKLLKLLDE